MSNDRLSQLSFMLRALSFEPFELFTDQEGKWNARKGAQLLHSSDSVQREVESWFSSLALDGIDILYLYGIGLGHYAERLLPWLQEKGDRLLIIIEDDPATIDAFLKLPISREILDHPRIHLEMIFPGMKWQDTIERLAQSFPSDRVEITHLASKKLKPAMRLLLLRKSALVNAVLAEMVDAHRFFGNLFPNFKRWPEAFYVNALQDRFKDLPAVICGAGPSLVESIPALKKLEQKALIIAGGSAIGALISRGIVPHLSMAIDPNPEEYERLKISHAFEIPLIYGNRVLPSIFATCNGPFGYIRSETGGPAEAWLERELGLEGTAIGPDLGAEALSITTLSVALAYHLGCNPIILCGVDLAYTGMQRYASGVVTKNKLSLKEMQSEKRALDQLVIRKDRRGKRVHTLVKWVMESETLSRFAEEHPERLFINATEGGLGFKAIPYSPLESVVQEHCLKSHDIRGRLHSEIQSAPISQATPERVDALLGELRASLERCGAMCDEMLRALEKGELPVGKMALYELDFQEELAFDSLLKNVVPALERVMNRRLGGKNEIELQTAKWGHLKSVIEGTLLVYTR